MNVFTLANFYRRPATKIVRKSSFKCQLPCNHTTKRSQLQSLFIYHKNTLYFCHHISNILCFHISPIYNYSFHDENFLAITFSSNISPIPIPPLSIIALLIISLPITLIKTLLKETLCMFLYINISSQYNKYMKNSTGGFLQFGILITLTCQECLEISYFEFYLSFLSILKEEIAIP